MDFNKILRAASALYDGRRGVLRPAADPELWSALGIALGKDVTWADTSALRSDMREWRTVPALPDYEVSEDGAVRRARAGRYRAGSRRIGYILKPVIAGNGYIVYNLRDLEGRQRTWLAHRLVAEAFLGPPPFPGAWVAHRDDIKTHNHYRNLRWATAAQNYHDAIRNGLIPMGEKHFASKLTNTQTAEIRAFPSGTPLSDIAKQYGVSRSLVSLIRLGRVRRENRSTEQVL